MAETQHNIGISRRALRDYGGALAAAEEAVRLAEQLGDEALSALALTGRAELHLVQGDVELAAVELARAAAIYERLQHPVGLAEVWRLEGAVGRGRRGGAGGGAGRSGGSSWRGPRPFTSGCSIPSGWRRSGGSRPPWRGGGATTLARRRCSDGQPSWRGGREAPTRWPRSNEISVPPWRRSATPAERAPPASGRSRCIGDSARDRRRRRSLPSSSRGTN